MDTNKLTYIIVLNYNSSECTIQCLESLVKLINAKFKIVVVDNFSSDSSIVQIKKWIQNKSNIFFKIIENKFNYGYSKGNNIGISYALNQKDCENLWILYNDCIVYKNSLEELLTANISSNSYNIWGSKILYENKKIQSLGCRINKYFMFSYHNYNSALHKHLLNYRQQLSLDDKGKLHFAFSNPYFLIYLAKLINLKEHLLEYLYQEVKFLQRNYSIQIIL